MSEIRQRYIRCDGPHCHKIETFWAVDDFELSQEMQLVGWESQPPAHLCPICKARAAAVQVSAKDEPGTDAYLRNATLVEVGDGVILIGEIYGDRKKRFADGESVRTSFVKQSLGHDIFKTKNSVYDVQSWVGNAPDVSKYFPRSKP